MNSIEKYIVRPSNFPFQSNCASSKIGSDKDKITRIERNTFIPYASVRILNLSSNLLVKLENLDPLVNLEKVVKRGVQSRKGIATASFIKNKKKKKKTNQTKKHLKI